MKKVKMTIKCDIIAGVCVWGGGVERRLDSVFNSGWIEGNVPFNNALNIFYLLLYGIEHTVKEHFDSEKRILLPPLYGLFLFY